MEMEYETTSNRVKICEYNENGIHACGPMVR